MSLDETNLSAQIKASGPSGNKGQPVDEQSDDQKTKHSRRDVTAFKTNEESRILQQPSAPVIEEEENSSASEYGENGDQPIYRHESDLPITTRDQPDIGLKLFEAPKAEAVKEEKFSTPRPCATLPNATSIEEIQEFMELYTSALIIGRSDYLKSKEIELQELLTTPAGRIAFVNALEQESRRTQGLVDLQALPKLLDQIGLLLVECQNAEDFSPAKKLLTISLQLYTYDPSVSTERTFIFAYIKNQPIWQSLRFWNACFFQSLQEARSKAEESSHDVTYLMLNEIIKRKKVLHKNLLQQLITS
ncbi:unnamed protein product [Heterobilharzia americana]|nr:unnamed protein product [Heterobilharzia americana]